MKSKYLAFLLVFMSVLVYCDKNNSNSVSVRASNSTSESINDKPSTSVPPSISNISNTGEYKIESAEGYEIDYDSYQYPTLKKTVSNKISSVTLNNEIKVSNGCTWILSKDIEGSQIIATKNMSLQEGHNNAYITVWDNSKNNNKTYYIDIYRLSMFSYAFYSDNTKLYSGTLEENQTVNEPANQPTKEGNTFVDWYDEEGNKVDFPYVIKSNKTFTAKWRANKYTINFDTDGGSTIDPIILDYGTEITLPIPTKDGYKFVGWIYNNKFISEKFILLENDIKLTASWIDENLTFTINKDYEILTITGCDKYITSITIPSSVKTIESGAFSNCSALVNVYYDGTIEDWCNITFSNAGSNPMSRAKHFYMLNNSNKYEEVTSIEIPNTVANIKKYQFYGFKNVTNITIPNSVTTIGEYAFSYCKSLTNITIPSGVTTIEDYAFYGCTSLTNITIPSSVTTIGNYVFEGCTFLTIYCETTSKPSGWDSNWNNNRPVYYGITEDNRIEKDGIIYVIQDNEAIVTRYVGNDANVTIPTTIELNERTYNVTAIGKSAFSNCTTLTSITIPSSVKTIESGAFSYCSALVNVYYDGTIENWCNIKFDSESSNPMPHAKHFYMLNSNNEYEEITSIEIPNTVTKIRKHQFYGFNNVTSITIPSSVTTIGKYAFSYCESLTIYCEVTSKPSGWDSNWNDNRPVYYGITKDNKIEKDGIIYVIQDNEAIVTKYVGKDTSLTIPTTIELNGKTYNVTTIGVGAFYNCTSLTNVTIPNSVTTIGVGAFYNCTSLTSITIPSSVTTIGGYAFSGCTSLTNITIPSSVTTIGKNAFYFCISLTIYCEATSKPSGWDSEWNVCSNYNYSDVPVIWGYKG